MAADPERAERRWVAVGVLVVAIVVAVQAVAGLVRQAVTDELSALERVETCLTERATPYEDASDDYIASSAARGALRTTVDGNAVTVAIGGSEDDAKRVHEDYAAVMTSDTATRLDLHGRVVLLWDREPTAAQRDFMYLCTLDVQA